MSLGTSRVMLIPHGGRHFSRTVLSGFVAPVLVGWPFVFLVSILVWALGSFSAAWYTALVLIGLQLIVGLVLAVVAFREQVREIRWIDLLPSVRPTVAVFQKGRGSDVVAVADLRSVGVVERFRLGRSTGSEIVFTTVEGRGITCPATNSGDRLMVPAATLGGWFADRLGPAGVEVAHETVVEQTNLTVENWYTAAQVAAVWQVPVQDVEATAGRLAVRSQMFIPRVGALHGVNRELTTMIYNPDDVHMVAAEVPTSSQRDL
jgi:hypothetical protein